MIRKIDKVLSPYEKYFMMEAPARKPYMKIVSAFPDGRLKSFDKNIQDPDEGEDDAETTDMATDEEITNPSVVDGDDDITSDGEGLDLVDDTDGFDPDLEDDMMNVDISNEDDTQDETTTGLDTEDPTGGDTPEPVDADGGTDITPTDDTGTDGGDGGLQTDPPADAGETDAGELQTDDPTADGTGGGDFSPEDPDAGGDGTDAGLTDDDNAGTNDATKPENTLDNQMKFSLYRNMKNLLVAIQNYEDKLDDMTTPSYNYNMTIKTVSNKLADLEEIVYQYMSVKFKDADYIVSMNFYQKCVTSLLLLFELIKSNKEKAENNQETLN